MGCTNFVCAGVTQDSTWQRASICMRLLRPVRMTPKQEQTDDPVIWHRSVRCQQTGLTDAFLFLRGKGCISVCISYATGKHVQHHRNLVPKRIWVPHESRQALVGEARHPNAKHLQSTFQQVPNAGESLNILRSHLLQNEHKAVWQNIITVDDNKILNFPEEGKCTSKLEHPTTSSRFLLF